MIIYSLLTAALAAPAISATIPSTSVQAVPVRAANSASVAKVLRSIREAVGYNHLSSFGPAIAIRERDSKGDFRNAYFGIQRGELRRGDDYVFDGLQGWQFDDRRRIRMPASLRQHEKAAWPMWVRSYWWLNPKSGIQVRLLSAVSSGSELALGLTIPKGIVGATLFVDRASWMPTRVVVPYERGPFTERYADYRSVRKIRFPFSLETSYRNTERRAVVSIGRHTGPDTFIRPALLPDFAFDSAKPAALTVKQGAPFPGGSPGHVYVRSVADGRQGWWHFDSGSDSMIIDESVARQLNMEVIGTHRSMGADGNVREGTWRRGQSFSVGRIRIERPVFRALDLSANNAPPGERRMGTIGYDLFARSVVEYGDGGLRVRICNPANYRLPQGGRWQRLEHIDSTPAARGVAAGIPGLFQLDTGSAGTVDFTKPFHEAHPILRSRGTRPTEVLGSGGTFSVEVGQLSWFVLGGQRYKDMEVAFRTGGISREGSAGTVGRDVLGRFTMVFDYPNQRLAFLPRTKSGRCG